MSLSSSAVCKRIGVSRATFPLTPALSLGERENRPPLRGESNALVRAGVLALNRGARGASGSDILPKKDAGCPFPLPAGEGQGEGERNPANQNGRAQFASSTRPAPHPMGRGRLMLAGSERRLSL